VCVRLEGGPLAEGLVLLLVLAAGRDFWRGSSLVTTAQFSSGLFGSSVPVCGGGVVFCCVSCWCALFVCGGVRFGVLCIIASSS
jgi:hypothetical protein